MKLFQGKDKLGIIDCLKALFLARLLSVVFTLPETDGESAKDNANCSG